MENPHFLLKCTSEWIEFCYNKHILFLQSEKGYFYQKRKIENETSLTFPDVNITYIRDNF